MLVGKRRCHSASRRALDETLHDEERLVNLLYGAAILAYCRGNGAYAYWATTELVDDGGENLVVYLIQAILVDVADSSECRAMMCAFRQVRMSMVRRSS